jgi:hypothetical protein
VPSILALVEEEAVRPRLYWDTEEVVEEAEVLHHELLLESWSGTLEKLRARSGEDDVIDIEHQVRSVNAMMVDEQRGVRLGLHKAQRDQVGGEAVVPRSQRLWLIEPAHQLRVCGVNEAGRLRAVDGLGECVVEEGVLDVKLVHGPTPGDSQSQHSPDGSRLDDGAEGLVVVQPGALSEPLKDPTSLVPIKRAVHLELVLEDPLVGDDIRPRRPRNQVSRAVRQHGLVLLHSATLVGVHKHATDRDQDRRQCRGSGGGGEL